MASKFSQKGVSLFLTIIILVIILSIVLGMSSILVGQIKTMREMGNSVIAFYAADTGMERLLNKTLKYIGGEGGSPQASYIENDIGNNASYEVRVVCCDSANPSCYFDGTPGRDCPLGLVQDSTCITSYFCIRSVGTYENTKRALEAEVFPTE